MNNNLEKTDYTGYAILALVGVLLLTLGIVVTCDVYHRSDVYLGNEINNVQLIDDMEVSSVLALEEGQQITIIYQEEHNHRVNLAVTRVVSNINQDTIHGIWFKDQFYVLDTTNMDCCY